MKLTVTGLFALTFVIISLSVLFFRIHKQKNIQENFHDVPYPHTHDFDMSVIPQDHNMEYNPSYPLPTPNMGNPTNNYMVPGGVITDSQCAFDRIEDVSKDTKEDEEQYKILEEKYKVPTFQAYHQFYTNTKEKIKNNNNSHLNSFIVDQYLQDIKTNSLKNEIGKLDDLIKISNSQTESSTPIDNSIKSIKSLKYGIALNTSQIGKEEQSIDSEKDPMMIFLNQGCLSYSPNGKESSDDTRSPYWVKLCQKNNADQLFKINQIKNKTDYNAVIDNPKLHQTTEDSDKIYPFNVVQPNSNNKQCLTLNKKGLSIENCLPIRQEDQIWNMSQEKRPC